MERATMQTAGGTRIQQTTGSEGPHYDPYSFEEWTVNRGGNTYVLHLGLAVWYEVNGVRTHQHDEASVENFERAVGLSLDVIQNGYWRARSRCKKCGSSRLEASDGYPGETLYICQKCGQICYCDFNRSAIE